MENLIKTIQTLSKRINAYGTDLSNNETMTRYALIDPLLRELAWDLSNPGEVVPEDGGAGKGGRTDYTMRKDGEDIMIIEAKRLDESLDKHINKLVDYVRQRNVRYGVLTNGQRWRMYDSRATTKTPATEFDIAEPEGVVISKAVKLHRSVVYQEISPKQSGPTPGLPYTPPEPEPHGAKHAIPIPEIRHQKHMPAPETLVFPDGGRTNLHSWTDLLVRVTEWLVGKNHLNESHCPVTTGPRNAIFNTRPFHQNQKKFKSAKKIGRFHLHTWLTSRSTILHSIKLIKTAGQKPSDFVCIFKD